MDPTPGALPPEEPGTSDDPPAETLDVRVGEAPPAEAAPPVAHASPPEPAGWGRQDVVGAVGLAALAGGLAWALGRVHGVDVAVGPDTPLWGGAALDLRAGQPSIVPPLYPALVAAGSLLGTPVAEVGRGVSLAAAAASAGLSFLAVRGAGGSRLAALAAGGIVALHPDTTLLALMFQPDAFTAGGMGLVALAMLIHDRRRCWASTAGVIAATALVTVAREHGLVLAPLVLLFLLLVPPARRTGRLVAPLALLLAVQLAPASLGVPATTPPWRWPWLYKVEAPLKDVGRLANGQVPPYVGVGVDSYPSGSEAQLRAIARVYDAALKRPPRERWERVVRLHLLRARTLSSDLYLLAAAGLLGAVAWARHKGRAGAPLGLGAALLVLAPTLVIWSARRHAAVLVPVAASGVGLGLAALHARLEASFSEARARTLMLGVALALAAATLHAGGTLRTEGLAWLSARAEERRPWAAFGQALRAATPPDALVAGFDPVDLVHGGGLVHLYAERPWVSGDIGPSGPAPALPWRVARVTRDDAPVAGAGWELLTEVGALRAWWYRPEVTGEARACLAGDLVGRRRFVFLQTPPRYRLYPHQGCPTEPRPPGAR